MFSVLEVVWMFCAMFCFSVFEFRCVLVSLKCFCFDVFLCAFQRVFLCFDFFCAFERVFSWIYVLFLRQCKRCDKWEREKEWATSSITIPLNGLQIFFAAKHSFILKPFIKSSLVTKEPLLKIKRIFNRKKHVTVKSNYLNRMH